jgi:asparagine synthase (glutamine-hydrolysing)
MCGIAGSYQINSKTLTRKMLAKLAHRGPDGSGLETASSSVLGHTRLAILDVEGGRQPMHTRQSRITFNGEIYNHLALRRRYLAGQRMRTHTDTEVVLRLYDRLGPQVAELLDGMFAFAIVSGDELFMARDPLGIKPLYYGKKGDVLFFASEIKALAEAADDIHEFPAGHWYHSRLGWRCFYDIHHRSKKFAGDERDALDSIQDILGESVRKRLMADDSSIVAALARQAAPGLHSFAVGMSGSPDLAAARKMAKTLGIRHHEFVYTERDMLENLPKAIYYLESFDPALVRSAIPNYFLARLAAEHVKVILTGEGADELYAGYDYLEGLEDPHSLQEETVLITAGLHNTNLQRADRMSMAFGLEARVPFLDLQSVDLAFRFPPAWKTRRTGRPAKALLRRAFRGDLPEEIVNRPKQKFSKGAGSCDVIAQRAATEIGRVELQSEQKRMLRQWDYHLVNQEALYYYHILRRFYEDRWIFASLGQSRSI